jgi:NifU-like protein involved in Fe-S cluster formation
MDNHIVESYIQNPIHNYLMEDADIEQHEGNPLCGDAITVHLKIQNNTITAYSYSGTYSSITGAAASFL